MRVPRAGIGKDDLVARFKAALDLDRIDRALTQFYRRADRFRSAVDQFENANGVVLLTKSRPPDEHHIIKPFELDRTFNAQDGPRTLR